MAARDKPPAPDGGGQPLGDEAFVGQMTASQRDLRTFIVGLIPHQVDADDVLQEVNLALWRKRHLYDPKQEYLRWAFGFAALEVRSFRSRAAKGRIWFSESTIQSLADEWPDKISFLEDCRQVLARCLQKLNEADRRVVEAKYGDSRSVKQIANDTEKPLSTVYDTLSRALKSLRNCVRRSQLQSSH